MRILSVKSQNILLVPFIDLKIKKVSLRELFLVGAGVGIIVDVLRGNPNVLLLPVGISLLFLGVSPVKFITREAKLFHFIQYKLRNNKTKSKRVTTQKPESAGIGVIFEEIQEIESPIINNTPVVVKIDSLDSPYVLSLNTPIKKQFVPVSIIINNNIIANTVTNRHGIVTCTIMIDEYGPKDVQVITHITNEKIFEGLSMTDSHYILYERRIIFEN